MEFGCSVQLGGSGAEGPKSISYRHLRMKVYAPRTDKAFDKPCSGEYNRGMKTETIYKSEAYPQVQNTEAFRDFIMWGCQGVISDPPTARWKFFDPVGAATWFISEAERVVLNDGTDDLQLFGWCDMGMGCPELGYVMLSELASISGPLGLGIERDIFFDPCPLSEVMS